jgi:hypothetical protein
VSGALAWVHDSEAATRGRQLKSKLITYDGQLGVVDGSEFAPTNEGSDSLRGIRLRPSQRRSDDVRIGG